MKKHDRRRQDRRAAVGDGARGQRQRDAPRLAQYRTIDYGDGHLTVRAIKRQIDGALGSRGAWLLEPYSDKPDSTGLNTTPVAAIDETARLAMANDYQLCVHAIGDRANRETLNIFEQAFKANPARTDLRWRVEHAQHLAPADIPRFGQLGVIASMQGIHCTSDAPYVLARLGAKARRGRRVRLAEADEERRDRRERHRRAGRRRRSDPELLRDVSRRRTKDGRAFYPDQRMSRMEALKSYTINGAYAAFEEDSRGSLKVGKLADMTVLSKDILTVPEDEIPTAQGRLHDRRREDRVQRDPGADARSDRTRDVLTRPDGPAALLLWLRGLRHVAPELLEEAAARTVEAVGQLTAGLSRHRSEPAPGRLRRCGHRRPSRATSFLRPRGRRSCSTRAPRAASSRAPATSLRGATALRAGSPRRVRRASPSSGGWRRCRARCRGTPPGRPQSAARARA